MTIYDIFKHDNFFYYGEPLHIVSVFDDTHYDRSDIDILNSAQRKFLLKQLKKYDYAWKSGRVLHSTKCSVLFTFPKMSVLGASPLDALKYEKSSDKNIVVVTPTQFCAQCIKELDEINGPLVIKELIEKHPVNLLKLRDHLSYTEFHEKYQRMLPELIAHQKKAISSGKLKYKRHIGQVIS